MQFNLLGIVLVQYMYTLYMHVWFSMCKFGFFGNIQTCCLPWDSFLWWFSVMLLTADFFCFSAVELDVHEVAEIMNCLAVYFTILTGFRIVQSLSKRIPMQFQNTPLRDLFCHGSATSNTSNTCRVINSDL